MPHSKIQDGVKLVFDELWQVGAGSSLGLLEEGRSVPLYQTVLRGLFRAVTLVLNRGAIERLAGLLLRGLHALLWSSQQPAARSPQ